MTWDDPHLKSILSGDTPKSVEHSSSYYNESGQPLWHGKLKHQNKTLVDEYLVVPYFYNLNGKFN